MSNEVWVAFIVAVVSPVFMAMFTAWNVRLGKREDYARQDRVADKAEAVAAKAAEVAERLAAKQDAIAQKTAEVAQQADRAAALLLAKQDAIAEQTRQVAQQADKAAALLLEKQESIASKADMVAERLASEGKAVANAAANATRVVSGRLEAIYTLTNSALSAALASELAARKRELEMMRELMSIRERLGEEPSAATAVTVELAATRIAELEATLAERRRQDEMASAQLVKIVGMENPLRPPGPMP